MDSREKEIHSAKKAALNNEKRWKGDDFISGVFKNQQGIKTNPISKERSLFKLTRKQERLATQMQNFGEVTG